METIYDSKQILAILPHRYPFVMVDRIVECDGKEWIVGLKNVSSNEPCFQGHFPGDPVFPGVLQLEAMAQTAGVLLNQIFKNEGGTCYYVGVDNARFRRIIRPGDQMRLEIKMLRIRMGMARAHGRVLVDGEVACEAEMMFGGGR